MDDIIKTIFRYGPRKAKLELDAAQVVGLRETRPSWFFDDNDEPRIVTPHGTLFIDYDRSVKVELLKPKIVRVDGAYGAEDTTLRIDGVADGELLKVLTTGEVMRVTSSRPGWAEVARGVASRAPRPIPDEAEVLILRVHHA